MWAASKAAAESERTKIVESPESKVRIGSFEKERKSSFSALVRFKPDTSGSCHVDTLVVTFSCFLIRGFTTACLKIYE